MDYQSAFLNLSNSIGLTVCIFWHACRSLSKRYLIKLATALMRKDQTGCVHRRSLHNPSNAVVRCGAHNIVAADNIDVVYGPGIREYVSWKISKGNKARTADRGQTKVRLSSSFSTRTTGQLKNSQSDSG